MAGSSKSVNREILLGPNEAETISYTVSRCFDYANIDEETITYVLYDEGTITPTTRLEEISVEVCQSCEGNDCNNDGDSCSKSTECGGGFCVESYCSNDDFCFDNNCNCNENEIQCDNNKQCVTIGNVAIDTETMCQKDEECTTGYLDPETMLCAKSPSQLEEENKDWNKFLIYAVLIFVCLIIFGLALFWYQKHRDKIEEQKIEELRQKTLQKEMDLTIIKLEAKNKRLEKIKKDIKEINFQKRKKREELIKLNLLKNNRTNLLGDINNIEQEIDRKWHDLKPFPDKQAKNRLVVINPYLGGYKCFYKKGIELKDYPYSSLIHRWVWKKNNGRSPRPGYHIHHIDEDKYNNDPRNLEEIWGKDHYKGHRNLK